MEIEIPRGKKIKEIIFEDKEPQVQWCYKTKISGFFIDGLSLTNRLDEEDRLEYHRNVFKTKEQALASIALSVLSQQKHDVNKGWIPNWSDVKQAKWGIYSTRTTKGNQFINIKNFALLVDNRPPFLLFEDEETAYLFSTVNRMWLQKAKVFL